LSKLKVLFNLLSCTYYPSVTSPTVKCTYYKAITDADDPEGYFKKRCFESSNKKLPVFIEYEGEAKNFPPPKHGNTKKSEQASRFTRTLPSMMAELNIRLETQKPAEVYRSLTNSEKVRNKRVCTNIRSNVNKKSSFGVGQIEGLYLMSLEYDFPSHLTLWPEFESVTTNF